MITLPQVNQPKPTRSPSIQKHPIERTFSFTPRTTATSTDHHKARRTHNHITYPKRNPQKGSKIERINKNPIFLISKTGKIEQRQKNIPCKTEDEQTTLFSPEEEM